MTKFKWHMMGDERPPEGNGDYVVMGRRGALCYARSFDGAGIFYIPNRRDPYMSIRSVKAWAEIPPLEVG